MHLLYLYVKFYDTQGDPAAYRNFPFWSINFSTDRYFRFIPETGLLSEPETERFLPRVPRDFWGERIYNVTAFVSSNGGGKSTIMQYLILLLADLAQNLPAPKRVTEDWVIVFETDENIIALQNRSALAKSPCQALHAGSGITCLCCEKRNKMMLSRIRQHLLHTKLLYLSNVMSKADAVFQEKWLTGGADRAKHFLFDASAYAMMHQASRRCAAEDDILQIYFAREQERMFRFLTAPEQRSLLERLREMDFPVPVPRRLTVYVHKIHFPEGALSSEEPYQWERLAFPHSWKNVWGPNDAIPALRVEQIIFSLCCGAAAGCFKLLDHVFMPENWLAILERLGAAGESAVPSGDENQVSGAEFLYLLDAVYNLLLKDYSQFKQVKGQLLQRVRLCQSYIEFLCSQRSRDVLAKYLPPADPIDRRLIQLGVRIQVKFIVPLDIALIGDDSENQSVWFVDFYQHYLKACGSTPYLTLDWGLSSGEENLLKMFTDLHEVCRPTGQREPMICNAKKRPDDGVYRCTAVWLFLDEADLTYHPEWQRQFMAILTTFLREVYPPEICREMQAFLSTHSPLMLGDFPSRCVAYLRHGRDGTRYVDDGGHVDTFGENLFTLLHNSFYLQNGEIGELAKRKIQNVIDFLAETQQKLESHELKDTDKENAYGLLKKYRDETVALLADGPIKTKLWLDIDRLEDQLIRSGGGRDSLIRALEEKLQRLKEEEESV